MSNRQSIHALLKLAVIADASTALAKADSAALKSATEQAYTDIAADIVETMVTGATYTDAARIARDTLDQQCNDVIFAAIQSNEVVFGDLGKLIRKADKLASRLMACAYAVIMEAPSGKINKLEAYAAHMRRGYHLCRVSHRGLTARLADSPDVTRNNTAKADPTEARIAALIAANEAMAMELEAARAALQAVVHGGEILGNMAQKKGRQRSKIIA
jgi:hypothetical protein